MSCIRNTEDKGSWSPDGARIAFTYSSPASQTDELYVIGADGSGARIAYVAASGIEGGGARAVWTVTTDGPATRTNLSGDNDYNEDCPFWSPDGTKLSFLSNREDLRGAGGTHIYTMNADGSGKRRAGDFLASVHVRDAGIWPPM